MERSPITGRVAWICFAFGLLITFVQLGRMPDDAILTADDGNKYLMGRTAESLLRPDLPYLGRALDPDFRWAPVRPPFAHVLSSGTSEGDGRRLVSQYPPAFAALSRVVETSPQVGKSHLWVSALSSVLLLVVVAAGARALGAPLALSLLFAWPLSPLLFYGTLHWEHVLVATLVTAGIAAWIRPFRFASVSVGVLFALATALREETALIFCVAALTLLFSRPRLTVLAAVFFLVGFFPFLFWQEANTGSWWGIHLQGNLPQDLSLGSWWKSRPDVFRSLMTSTLPATELGGVAVGLTLSAFGAFLCSAVPVRNIDPPRSTELSRGLDAHQSTELARGVDAPRSTERSRDLDAPQSTEPPRSTDPSSTDSVSRAGGLALLFLGIFTLAIATLALVWRGPAPTVLLRCGGLLLFAPWALFALTPLHSEPLRLLRKVLVFALLALLLATPPVSAAGIHWGPRILLSLLPALAFVSAAGAVRAWRTARPGGLGRPSGLAFVTFAVASTISVGALQLSGLELQLRSVRAIGELREQTIDLAQEWGTGAELPVVTHLWWYAQVFAPMTQTKPIYLIHSRQDFAEWFDRSVELYPRQFLWATTAPNNDIFRGLPVRVAEMRRVRHPNQPDLGHRLLLMERTR